MIACNAGDVLKKCAYKIFINMYLTPTIHGLVLECLYGSYEAQKGVCIKKL